MAGKDMIKTWTSITKIDILVAAKRSLCHRQNALSKLQGRNRDADTNVYLTDLVQVKKPLKQCLQFTQLASGCNVHKI